MFSFEEPGVPFAVTDKFLLFIRAYRCFPFALFLSGVDLDVPFIILLFSCRNIGLPFSVTVMILL